MKTFFFFTHILACSAFLLANAQQGQYTIQPRRKITDLWEFINL